MTDNATWEGQQRTDLHCTQCSKGFVAVLDYDVDGNHVIECPWCGHEHCRVIERGRVTDERYDSRSQRPDVIVDARHVWKSDVLPARTSSASQFLSDIWLRKEEG